MQSQLQEATDSLESTGVAITDKQTQIDETTTQLGDLKSQLGDGMRSTYKQGSQSVIDVVLGSTSVEDLVSRVYYLDRISRQQAQTISEVLTTEQRLEAEKSELEDTQASQQRAVEDMQGEVDAYQAKVNEAQTYYDSLDAQVKAQLAEEAARAAETNQATNVSTAVEAIQNSQTSQGSTTSGQKENGTSAGNQQQGGTTGGTTSGGTTSGGTTGGSSSGSGASVPQGGGVAAAYAALGCPYVYAAARPQQLRLLRPHLLHLRLEVRPQRLGNDERRPRLRQLEDLHRRALRGRPRLPVRQRRPRGRLRRQRRVHPRRQPQPRRRQGQDLVLRRRRPLLENQRD